MSFSDFSSWPREQEQAFVVYEQRITESQSKAWTIGGIAAGILLLFAVGVYFGISPQHTDVTKDMNMSNLTKKSGGEAKGDAKTDAPAAEKK